VKPAAQDDSAALFGVSEVVKLERKAASLGTQVTESPRMAAQRSGIPRAPEETRVAALIDALVQAGGRLSRAEAAEIVGIANARMSGYLSQLMRLLNIDGYPVLQTLDAGQTVDLNVSLLRQQFFGS
jgi:hypothetical protein